MERAISLTWTCCIALGAVIGLSAAHVNAQDDWHIVSRHVENRGNPAANSAKPASSEMVACGERATPASSQMKTIVRQIDDLWRADIQVYESVHPWPPHARPGGCIFYNARYMNVLLARFMDVRSEDLRPVLYAIMAHEVGHELHHDFDRKREGVPSKTLELEADRFAGYTMEELDIPPTNITPYYALGGDEFAIPNAPKHGKSGQRVSAFERGWHLAEWGRSEDSGLSSFGGSGESVPAPESSDSSEP
jgi:predicted metalloprotease